MNTLQSIEQQFGFKYPNLYKQLFDDKMLDWGESQANWYKTVFPTLKDNPPLFLFATDFEMIDFEQVVEEIEDLTDPDYFRDINPDFLFVPFGQSAAGDLFCFFYNKNTPSQPTDIPIVLLWHDSDEAQFLAKNLQDFIFRMLIESVVDIFDAGLIADGDFYQNITNFLKTHQRYLPENQKLIVKEIFERKITHFTENHDTYKGLLSRGELQEILKQHIDFEQFDETFNPSVEREWLPPKNIKGTLYLRITPIPPLDSLIYNDLKALNWRQNKNFENGLEYFRKVDIFWVVEEEVNVLDYLMGAFKERLDHIKNTYEGVEIVFENE